MIKYFNSNKEGIVKVKYLEHHSDSCMLCYYGYDILVHVNVIQDFVDNAGWVETDENEYRKYLIKMELKR